MRLHRSRLMVLKVPLLLIALTSCGSGEIGQPLVPDEELFLSLAEGDRREMLALLAELRGTAGTAEREPSSETAQEVSDEALARDFSVEDRDAMLARWHQLRAAVSEKEQFLQQLEQEARVWEALTEQLERRGDLGPAKTEALGILEDLRRRVEREQKEIGNLRRSLVRDRELAALSLVSRGFTRWDWAVIALYLVFTTILGGALAGKQATIRDFFLGGRKLPWYAVCGSIIATELSAATFLIAPAIVFSKGGDLTYIQLAIGTIIARFVIGYFFVPAYYEREIYSPYDYMGNRLGGRVKNITTFLFMAGAVLAQGARVYIAALALQVITGTDITLSIVIIGVVSIAWTWIGGIRTVIWTDVIQFLLFVSGAVVAFVFIQQAVDGGLGTVLAESYQSGKLKVLNTNLNTKEAFTLWCGLFATGFATLASHGTDQMVAQRMFTCEGPAQARKAVIWSSVGILLTLLLLFVGAGLFVYYRHYPLSHAEQVVVDAQSMKIFAIFIVGALPVGISGLLMAGIFATAISTLDSVLAALAQTTVSSIYRPFVKPNADDRHELAVSRILVILWGVFMTGFAIFCDYLQRGYADLIQFALAMAAYTYGALLGTLLLALLPTRRDDRGLLWGVPLSVLTVFSLNWHAPVTQAVVVVACVILAVSAFRKLYQEPGKLVLVLLVTGLVLLISLLVVGRDASGTPQYISLAWPWHFPIGTAITLGLGYLIGRKRH